jgi:hypothetical protein
MCDERHHVVCDDGLPTPYDEFPVHQTPEPFSVPSVSDDAFDDGFSFGVFSAEHEVFLFTGLRVNPNNDMVGGYAGVMRGGVQTTVRFKRRWRPDSATRIGHYRRTGILPRLDDDYAISCCHTIRQVLASVAVRAVEEAPALHADNAELRVLLARLRADVPDEVVAAIDEACARPRSECPPLAELHADAIALRSVLERCIESITDPEHPGRVAIRVHLARQRPWMVDAFQGRRR